MELVIDSREFFKYKKEVIDVVQLQNMIDFQYSRLDIYLFRKYLFSIYCEFVVCVWEIIENKIDKNNDFYRVYILLGRDKERK